MKKQITILAVFLFVTFSAFGYNVPIDGDATLMEKLFFGIFPTKIDRQFKNYAKTGSIEEMQTFFDTQLTDEDLEKAKRRNPVLCNMLLGLIAESEQDTAKAYEYFAIAYSVDKNNFFSSRDLDLMQKIIKDDFSWVYDKQKIYADYYQNLSNKISDEIERLENEIETLTQLKDELKDAIITDENLRETYISIETQIADYKRAIKELEDIKNGLVSPENAVFVKKIENRHSEISQEVEIILKNIQLGVSCSDGIKNSAVAMFKERIENAKETQNSKVSEISLEIIGHADGVGYGKKVGQYNNNDTIRGSYRNKDGVLQEILIKKGDYYTNEQLAFFRATCPYQKIMEAAAEMNITIQNCYFSAIEHKEIGENYRKIELTITVIHMFQYYDQKMDSLKNEVTLTVQKIDNYNEKIAELRRESNEIEILLKGINQNILDFNATFKENE